MVADALGRQAARRLFDRAASAPGVALRRLPFVGARLEKALPDPATTPAPLLLPGDGAPNFLFASPREVLDAVAPPLNRDDELYALDVTKLLEDAAPDDEARATLETLLGGGAGAAGPVAAARTLLDIATSASNLRRPALPRAGLGRGGARTAGRARRVILHVASELDDAERAALRESGAPRRAWRSASGGGSSRCCWRN